MPSERFYLNAPLEDIVFLEGAELHHLVHVMRICVGEQVELVNGQGVLAKAQVTEISKRKAALQIVSKSISPLPPPSYTLAIPLLRLSKLEWIIEKGTELGADAFVFYPAEYSEKEDLSENQLERLHYIAASALKQCGRLDLPSLQIIPLARILQQKGPCFFGDTRTDAPLITPQPNCLFISGPEKGFSKAELLLLDEKAKGVRLHPNILRAETAPLAALCILNYKGF